MHIEKMSDRHAGRQARRQARKTQPDRIQVNLDPDIVQMIADPNPGGHRCYGSSWIPGTLPATLRETQVFCSNIFVMVSEKVSRYLCMSQLQRMLIQSSNICKILLKIPISYTRGTGLFSLALPTQFCDLFV
jgi:hypothetical protein